MLVRQGAPCVAECPARAGRPATAAVGIESTKECASLPCRLGTQGGAFVESAHDECGSLRQVQDRVPGWAARRARSTAPEPRGRLERDSPIQQRRGPRFLAERPAAGVRQQRARPTIASPMARNDGMPGWQAVGGPGVQGAAPRLSGRARGRASPSAGLPGWTNAAILRGNRPTQFDASPGCCSAP